MKKRKKWVFLGMLSLVLCACASEASSNNEEKNAEVTSEVQDYEQSEEQRKEETQEEFQEVEKISWTELEVAVDEEISRHNSNFLNYGYLTYDEAGNIYYMDLNNNHNIYVSDYRGENKRLLGEDYNNAGWMRVDGDWLYLATENTAILRLNVATGEVQQLAEEYSGHFRLENSKLYWEDKRDSKGFRAMNPDGESLELLQDTSEFSTGFYSLGNDFWIAEADVKATKTDEKYIAVIDKDNLRILKEKGIAPLVAGSYISVVDPETQQRHIWNLKTKEDFNLDVRTDQTIVSDGTTFYYKELKYDTTASNTGKESATCFHVVYQWDGETTKEIWRISSVDLYHMYITPMGLYFLPQVNENGRYQYQLWYYEFETENIFQIY